MTRLDVIMAQKMEVERQASLLAIYGGLEQGVSKAGGELTGFSMRLGELDCLLTLRAVFPGGAMIGFVGGEDVAHCMRKGATEAARDLVRWRPDKWRGNGGLQEEE